MQRATRVLGLAFIFALAGVFVTTACDEPPTDVDIIYEDSPGHYGVVNGTATNYTMWKGVIALYGQVGSSGTLCTGTFIDPEVILTAGHCVYYPSDGINFISNPSNLYIIGGANIDNQSSIVWYFDGVDQIIDHPTWTGNIADINTGAVDMALIRVSGTPYTAIPEFYNVRSSNPSVGESGTIVGYGNNVTGSGSGTHRVGYANILSSAGSYIEIGGTSGTCQGDSGGPFFVDIGGEPAVTGVTSFGASSTCTASGGNYDTVVPYYFDWINQYVQSWTGHSVGEGTLDSDSDTDGDTDSDTDGDTDSDTDSDMDSDSDGDGDEDVDDDDSDNSEDENYFGINNSNPVTSCSFAWSAADTGILSILSRLL